jgi:ATP-dependent DNA ligase
MQIPFTQFAGRLRQRASLPIGQHKQILTKLVRKPHPGIALNDRYVGDGDVVCQQACQLGCEGIVSKQLGSPYRSGRSKHWLKVKNPAAPAVQREAEEDWRSVRRRTTQFEPIAQFAHRRK